MRIVVGENLPKRVAILRNGMFITDQMDKLKRFGDFKEFTAVLECHSKKGNMLLRDMEPPKHNDFEFVLLPPSEQPRGQRALSEMAKWVRDMLKRHAQDPIDDVSEVKELADYFADDSGESGGEKGEEINPTGKIQIRAQPHRRRAVVVNTEEEGEEGGRGNGGGGGGGGGGAGGGTGRGSGGTGSKSQKLIELSNVRSVVLSRTRRRIAATPTFDGKMQLILYEAGADTDRLLKVVKTSAGKVQKGKGIVQDIKARRGMRFTVEVELDDEFAGAMKVVGYAV